MEFWAYVPSLARGALVTAGITLAAIAIGAVSAFVAGIARVEGGRIAAAIALCYTEVFRGTSLLVQLFWFYYALPLVGLTLEPVATGVTVLALHVGAYGSEIVRGALNAVSPLQREAARALNFGRGHTLVHVVLPQAVVEMMPALGNLAIETLKLSSLVSLISITDLTFRAQAMRNLTLDSTTVYALTLIGYFAMSLVLMLALRLVERLVRRGAAFPKAAHA
ncbi:ectoine/hydroxyectoine ABC transporter permease subunit EhuC [Verminephrobacter aporrectodeae]|uniref:Ectoine/hydroxyectoine ABC transporter permease subunit EhuC n=1 Tax=Verminephrobacter aporrectodeae subsp. tuberculatae TaxID=1110392 RepID=A0ABT3KRE9_9BURK|nr:ectoine/hydroxyectoine ABC transporter permease subunit EhuC [Verminephrobacter aporrectodeae]MCW5220655.1 ectoine/hydroxyectoine ABC transporter permease subunit EhuC [Verminephrobacter aporrectodeae subsp. tuberculatae]MCW5255393.1 ectoine/hydroxyectoine ABC transporter permease subunit EhuC [Verminephrobacter aporrectodeae subsp. tuberculatae]MCW5289950.1 ectoine/hydroxyectoine ABC transporter permease subunit EhuC [Verminephrobacter aporrectodeae subsp. tuberculatae]MCW5320375.1 ectoine/